MRNTKPEQQHTILSFLAKIIDKQLIFYAKLHSPGICCLIFFLKKFCYFKKVSYIWGILLTAFFEIYMFL